MAKPADKVFQGRPPAGAPQAAPGEAAKPVGEEPTAEPSGDFPCSVAQERFWLLDRLDPGSSSYNVAVRWRLEGRVTKEKQKKVRIERTHNGIIGRGKTFKKRNKL